LRAYIGITDSNWFELLRSQPQLDEVNFWQPGGNRAFSVIKPGELFLFKLHSPQDYIVGGGVFWYSNLYPMSMAWESFGIKNGVTSLSEMRSRIGKYRRIQTAPLDNYVIGCVLLEQPFFLPEESWIPIPSDWHPSIVQGRTYNLSEEPGNSIWKALKFGLPATHIFRENQERYGEPTLIVPRLGQGSFRVMVTDAYERRCAITSERTLPALEAAHIVPFSELGLHTVSNGILLRKDLHSLFDKGYITVTSNLSVEVSRKIKEEFENGKDYYRLHGSTIRTPANSLDRPARASLDWHNEHVFLG
jgi:putative restriction endonuclease